MISLVVTTQGNREFELDRFLTSLVEQTYQEFEVIIINQNQKEKINLNKYKNLKLKTNVINTYKMSLSCARNIGLKEANGNIVAFPDDDCWYSSEVLSEVCKYFESNTSIDFICTSVYDPIKSMPYGRYRNIDKDILVSNNNIFSYPISVGIFIKTNISDVKFDEKLGAGNKWGSGEETDLLLDLFFQKKVGMCIKSIKVFHEIEKNNIIDYKKTEKYSLGYGALLAKSIFLRNQKFAQKEFYRVLLISIAGMIVYTLKLQIKRTKNSFIRYKYLIKGMSEGKKYYENMNKGD